MRIGERVRLKLNDGKIVPAEVKEVFPREGFCLVSHQAGPWVGVPERQLAPSRSWGEWVAIGLVIVAVGALVVWLYLTATGKGGPGWRMQNLELEHATESGSCAPSAGRPSRTACV